MTKTLMNTKDNYILSGAINTIASICADDEAIECIYVNIDKKQDNDEILVTINIIASKELAEDYNSIFADELTLLNKKIPYSICVQTIRDNPTNISGKILFDRHGKFSRLQNDSSMVSFEPPLRLEEIKSKEDLKPSIKYPLSKTANWNLSSWLNGTIKEAQDVGGIYGIYLMTYYEYRPHVHLVVVGDDKNTILALQERLGTFYENNITINVNGEEFRLRISYDEAKSYSYDFRDDGKVNEMGNLVHSKIIYDRTGSLEELQKFFSKSYYNNELVRENKRVIFEPPLNLNRIHK